MGNSNSSSARVSQVSSVPIPKAKPENDSLTGGRVLDTPIFMDEKDSSSTASNSGNSNHNNEFPTPTGHEYDLMDKIAAELPNVIDEQSKQQVQDYKQACNGGKGPMVACFATAEFLSLFERKHQEAFELYQNTCFRPLSDKSPNGVKVDRSSKAYGPACFNMAQMLLTGKGGVEFNRPKAFSIMERACKAGHGGACHLQAKMLLTPNLDKNIPFDPPKACDLLQHVCDDGDSYSCFLLATMLLRGSAEAEAQAVTRQEAASTNEGKLKRDPGRAEQLLLKACQTYSHAPSCYNLAVMYTQGDDGVPKDEDKARAFQQKTEEMVDQFGGMGM